MAKRKKTDVVHVHIDRKPFTYQLNKTQKRTLPLGWKGTVAGNVADDIEQEG
ncbi:MAG: hypothetical protein GY717_09435, partial [Rhodobacteraceae bacterium]|nr:hypothetical protein [Paracoccaceae bacterium]